MKIIGLCGYQGSGKTEIAKYLAENYRFKRLNFKDGLVEEMKERLPDTLKAIAERDGYAKVDDLFVMKPAIMRALLQNYGTEVRRNDDLNYWAAKWTKKANEMKCNLVADDVRFFNELSAIVEKDGILIRVIREDVKSGGDHSSEKEQEKFIEDFTIVAKKGDLLGAFKQADQIMEHIKAD